MQQKRADTVNIPFGDVFNIFVGFTISGCSLSKSG